MPRATSAGAGGAARRRVAAIAIAATGATTDATATAATAAAIASGGAVARRPATAATAAIATVAIGATTATTVATTTAAGDDHLTRDHQQQARGGVFITLHNCSFEAPKNAPGSSFPPPPRPKNNDTGRHPHATSGQGAFSFGRSPSAEHSMDHIAALADTGCGLFWWSALPSPSSPLALCPHEYRSPCAESIHVCPQPHDSSAASGHGTRSNVCWFVLCPSPSAP